jgi:thiol:disulfide interchange protein DsbD
MKWIPLLMLSLLVGPSHIVIVSNSIDHSPELISYVQEHHRVLPIEPIDFSEYQQYDYYILLGGPDAPEGMGDIVQGVLSMREQDYLRRTEEYNLFIRMINGKMFFILAGSDRENTQKAVEDLKDDVLSYIPGNPIRWGDNLEMALEKAQRENKLVYIEFYTEWCKYCTDMDDITYTDPRIIKLLTDDFIPVKLNKEHAENADIINTYRVYGQPYEIVITPQGELVWSHRGYINPEALYLFLISLLENSTLSG